MLRRILDGIKVALGVAALLLIAALFALMFWPLSLLGLLLVTWGVIHVWRWERGPRLEHYGPTGPPPRHKPGPPPESSPVPAPPLPPVGHAGAALRDPEGQLRCEPVGPVVVTARGRVLD